ncbi:MAG: amino acid ABC transporter ATP-binding protein [Actinomycetota bacterium]
MSFLSRSQAARRTETARAPQAPIRSAPESLLWSPDPASDGSMGAEADVGAPEFIEPTQDAEPEVEPPAVACRGVSKWFEQFQVLDDITFEVQPGEVSVLIGRSGAGKSTMLRCLNGLELATVGQVEIHGCPVTDDPYVLRALRSAVGIVFQNFNLFPQYSVERNVVLAQRLVLNRTGETAEASAVEVLDRVGMLAHRNKYPSQLSGGEQQRVAIARALAMSPSIVLLDEPTASVDPELTKGIMDLVREIAESNVTVIAVTHEMGFVKAAADHVHFFEEGRLLESGPVDRFFSDPSHPRTRQFISDARLLY